MTNAKVHDLHADSKVASYIRLGHTGYRKLEDLHAAGRLPIKRAIIEATNIDTQSDLLNTLKNSNVEIFLDTKSAELACLGSFSSSKVKSLPWVYNDRPYIPDDFTKRRLIKYVEQIAEFAVSKGVSAVLSPSHALSGPLDPWLKVDIEMCEVLRESLDRLGGQHIIADYPLLINMSTFRDEASRLAIINSLIGLPFVNLWLRVSSFGNDATPAALRKYINGAWDLRKLGKPIIADGVGGLVSMALLSFGATGGIAHGIAQKERFNVNDWKKPRSGGGGSAKRIYLPDLDIYLSKEQSRELFKGRNIKSKLGCNIKGCCSELEDMFRSPEAHFLHQRHHQITEINETPDFRRRDHFLEKQLGAVCDTGRKISKTKVSDDVILKKIVKHTARLELMSDVLTDLHKTTQVEPRAMTPYKCKLNEIS